MTEPVPTVERPQEERDPRQPLAMSSPPSLDLLQLDCGALARKPLTEEPVALLGGALTVRGFVETDSTPRSFNVMWAPKPPEQETRTMATADGDRFVVLARALHQLAPEGDERAFEQAAAEYLQSQYRDRAPRHRLVRVPLGGELRGVGLLADELLAQGDAALAMALLVAQPDGLLHDVSFYVSPHLRQRGCIDMAHALAASIRPGPRSIARRSRTETLDAQLLKLTLALPEDWVVVRQPGPDFVAFHVHKLMPLGRYPGKMMIYVGRHPDRSEVSGATELATGTLAGTPVSWRGTREALSMKALATLPAGLSLMVVLRATQQATFLDEMHAVAETLQLPPSPTP